MIEVKNLIKSFDENEIVKDVSTTFVKGKTNLIIGQSGSGKTVLLKCLLGLYAPDSGEIIYDGISNKMMNDSNKTLLRREIIPEFIGLWWVHIIFILILFFLYYMPQIQFEKNKR